MNKILIIKLGALGDVIRTTPLLRILKGEITWVTQSNALPLLQNISNLARVIEIGKGTRFLQNQKFDLILSLDEDIHAARLANSVKKKELIGSYEQESKIDYTDSAREWFDMSLISKLGKQLADQKKWRNKKSYQEHIFAMLGKKFKGQEYILPYKSTNEKQKRNNIVGIETRSGERWIAKRWDRFSQFEKILRENGILYCKFKQSPTLKGYMKQIDNADCVVTTDSLALHIALGLKKKVIALFTCTSPSEIYGYGRAVKIISPLLGEYFYTTEPTLKPGNKIEPEKVYRAMKSAF